MACFICLGVVNSSCGELKYANFSEINSNYSCIGVNLEICFGRTFMVKKKDFGT